MDWKSFDEYAAKRRQEALDAQAKEAEQRARYSEEGKRALQQLLDILQGGKPSRDYMNPPEAPVPERLDKPLYTPPTWNDTTPVYRQPQWLPKIPGTQDNMPIGPRPGAPKVPATIDQMPLVPQELPQNGMLHISGSPSTDMPAGGMNPLFLEMQRRERYKSKDNLLRQTEENIRPLEELLSNRRREEQLQQQLENIQPGTPAMEEWLKGLVPGVNGQPVPNPNPAPHPQGPGVRGMLGQSDYMLAGTESAPRGFGLGYPGPRYIVIMPNGKPAGKYWDLDSAKAAARLIGPGAIIVPIQ